MTPSGRLEPLADAGVVDRSFTTLKSLSELGRRMAAFGACLRAPDECGALSPTRETPPGERDGSNMARSAFSVVIFGSIVPNRSDLVGNQGDVG
jgi:hypothetical protein